MEIARKSVGPIMPNMVLSIRDRRKREEKSGRKVSLLFRHERRKFFFKRAVNCGLVEKILSANSNPLVAAEALN